MDFSQRYTISPFFLNIYTRELLQTPNTLAFAYDIMQREEYIKSTIKTLTLKPRTLEKSYEFKLTISTEKTKYLISRDLIKKMEISNSKTNLLEWGRPLNFNTQLKKRDKK